MKTGQRNPFRRLVPESFSLGKSSRDKVTPTESGTADIKTSQRNPFCRPIQENFSLGQAEFALTHDIREH